MKSRPLLTAMSHPVVVLAVSVLLVNDHVLKELWPGWVTGKLSDFAGLVFFPILLGAAVQLIAPGRFRTRTLLAGCVAATGLAFAMVQLSPLVGAGYETGLGYLQWPFRFLADGSSPMPVVLTQDPTDLIALPALWIAWRIASRQTQAETYSPRRLSPGLSDTSRRPAP